MLYRRFAAAIGLVAAGLVSQAPEFTQQYRQRLGGALDELQAMVARFDTEVAGESLTRDQGIARLRSNADPLVQGRGAAVEEAVARADRLARQREAFRSAGPLSQYGVLLESFDLGLARRTAGDYQPAAPLTLSGLVAAVLGFVAGWLLSHLVALPFRRSSARAPSPVHATHSVGAPP